MILLSHAVTLFLEYVCLLSISVQETDAFHSTGYGLTKSWCEARDRCKRESAQLVRIHTRQKHRDVMSFLDSNNLNNHDVWFDLHLKEDNWQQTAIRNYTYVDSTGTVAPWLHWTGGEPNKQDAEKCLRLSHSKHYKFRTTPCTWNEDCYFLCEGLVSEGELDNFTCTTSGISTQGTDTKSSKDDITTDKTTLLTDKTSTPPDDLSSHKKDRSTTPEGTSSLEIYTSSTPDVRSSLHGDPTSPPHGTSSLTGETLTTPDGTLVLPGNTSSRPDDSTLPTDVMHYQSTTTHSPKTDTSTAHDETSSHNDDSSSPPHGTSSLTGETSTTPDETLLPGNTSSRPDYSTLPTDVIHHQSTTTQSQTNQVFDAILSCPPCHCDREAEYNLSDPKSLAKLNQKLVEIKANLTLNKKTLRVYMNSKISARDPRVSATMCGLVGITVLVGVVSCIVLPDVVVATRFVFNKVKKYYL